MKCSLLVEAIDEICWMSDKGSSDCSNSMKNMIEMILVFKGGMHLNVEGLNSYKITSFSVYTSLRSIPIETVVV